MKILIALFLLFCAPVNAAEFVHALSLHGTPKYDQNISHFDYTNPNAPKGGTFKMSALGSFDNLNPFILKGLSGAEISGNVYQTLMTSSLDEPFTQYGLLAQSASIADDKKSITYKIHPKAHWSDGQKVTPADVKFSFEILTTKGAPAYRYYYADIERVSIKKYNEIMFHFKSDDNPELPLIIGQLPILPKHVWKDQEFDKTTLDKNLIVGSGPYKISDVKTGNLIRFEKVKKWWGDDLAVNKGRFNFDMIEVHYYRDATVALESFFSGGYDFRLENVAKTWATGYNVPQVKNGEIIKEEIKHNMVQGMQGFIFNTRRAPLNDIKLREAMALAFDFEWSNKRFAYGAYTRTNSYFDNSELSAEGLPTSRELEILNQYKDKLTAHVFTKVINTPKTDGTGNNRDQLRGAIKILEDAGYALNDKNQRVDPKTGKPLSFEIIDTQQAFERWVLPYARNLKKIGIELTFRIVDSAQYSNRMNDLDFDMTIGQFPQSLSPGNEQYNFWHSKTADKKGSRNLAGVNDPVIDELVRRIARAKNREELVALTKALDRILLAGHYVVPHWHIATFRVAYWDRLEHGPNPPYGLPVPDNWWYKQELLNQ